MSEGQKKVLAVDDDPGVLKAIGMALQVAGYEVITAENGVEALKKVESEAPDLILLDVMMPELDGFATCAKLKSSPESQGIPVVLLTAVADHVTKTRYPIDGVMKAEADEYLPKPVDPKELMTVVDGLLTGGS